MRGGTLAVEALDSSAAADLIQAFIPTNRDVAERIYGLSGGFPGKIIRTVVALKQDGGLQESGRVLWLKENAAQLQHYSTMQHDATRCRQSSFNSTLAKDSGFI